MLTKFFEVNSELESKRNEWEKEWEKDCETEREKASLECNEAQEAYEKSVEVCEKLKLEGPNKVAFREVYKMSRTSEEAAAVNLKDKLGLGDDYEIRFMDANSLIEGMEFEEKEEFLRLLNVKENEVEENVIPHIERYLNDVCTFSDKGLEKEVRSDVLKGCRQSKIYRDNFITLIARVKMPQPFFSKKIFDLLPSSAKGARPSSSKHDGKLHFVRGKGAESDYNIITLGNEKKVYGRSLDSTDRISGRGFFYYSGVKSDVLPHEEGHSISADLAQYASTPATMDAVSKLAKFDKNENNAARNRRYIESIAALPEKRKELLEWFPQAIEDKYKDVSDPNTLATALVDHQTNPADVVASLFSDTLEVFQILGLGIFENGKKKILCINLLSDLARNLEQGRPIQH
ncbi:hypothetical protein FACS1894122_14920 [Alphaproteobacteria bacterium]|nr:hypothetical protein FACS1894122_14920 [Alphaproteobacteria bacterium]